MHVKFQQIIWNKTELVHRNFVYLAWVSFHFIKVSFANIWIV